MSTISTYYNNFITDLRGFSGAKKDGQDNSLRVTAIALRVLGALSAAIALAATISAVATIAASAVIPAGLTITAIIAVVVAHELFVIGNNIHVQLNPVKSPGNFLIAVQKIASAIWNDTDLLLTDTWIVGSVYKLCKK